MNDKITILKVPLVPFLAALILVAYGAILSLFVDPAGVIFCLLGLGGFFLERDIAINGYWR